MVGEVWTAVCEALRKKLRPGAYNTWVAPARLVDVRGGQAGCYCARVVCENEYVIDYLQGQLDRPLREALAQELDAPANRVAVQYARPQ